MQAASYPCSTCKQQMEVRICKTESSKNFQKPYTICLNCPDKEGKPGKFGQFLKLTTPISKEDSIMRTHYDPAPQLSIWEVIKNTPEKRSTITEQELEIQRASISCLLTSVHDLKNMMIVMQEKILALETDKKRESEKLNVRNESQNFFDA